MNLNMVLFLCFFPVFLIIFAQHYSLTKPRKNLILNVTLPHSARSDEVVLSITGGYKRWLIITAVPIVAAPIYLLFSKTGLPILTMLFFWLLAAMAVPVIIYTLYRRRLVALKQKRGWTPPEANVILVDTVAALAKDAPLKLWWFLPPLLMTLIPLPVDLIRGQGIYMSSIALVNTGMILLLYVLYRVIYRQRSEIIDSNTSLTIALTRIRRRGWSKSWLIMSWVTGIWSLSFMLPIEAEALIVSSSVIYSLAVIAITMYIEFSIRGQQERLTAQSGIGDYVDEDRYWINGMFYYNPNDRHFMKNDRIGISSTVNLAHPAGMATMIISLLLVAAMPFLGMFLSHMEKTGVSLEIAGGEIIASHVGKPYVIELASIEEAELYEELPKMSRVMGTGLDTVLQGNFRIIDGEDCKVNLNPTCPPFIALRSGGVLYILGANDSGVTREIWERLK